MTDAVEIVNDLAIMENNMEVVQEITNRITIQFSNPIHTHTQSNLFEIIIYIYIWLYLGCIYIHTHKRNYLKEMSVLLCS